MFYCDYCAIKLKWPITAFKSDGKCEMCSERAVCNDTPSYQLPRRAERIEHVGSASAIASAPPQEVPSAMRTNVDSSAQPMEIKNPTRGHNSDQWNEILELARDGAFSYWLMRRKIDKLSKPTQREAFDAGWAGYETFVGEEDDPNQVEIDGSLANDETGQTISNLVQQNADLESSYATLDRAVSYLLTRLAADYVSCARVGIRKKSEHPACLSCLNEAESRAQVMEYFHSLALS